jgi:outer membrane protein OmpA-like peptidoglycan-associated protein
MTVTKFFFFFLYLFTLSSLTGQNIDRANELYKNGGFAQAIPIYEAALAKKPNSSAIKIKLANCHRILSHPVQAARLFAEIIETKDAKPIDFMHFGETLMMLEKYDSAKIFFRKFTDLKPDDERGLLLLRNVDKVKTLRPLFEGVTVFPFLHNSDADDNAPVWSPKGIVFASDRPSGFKLMKEKNPATGRDYTNLYLSERVDDSTFNLPKEFSSKLAELNRNTSNATLTSDGLRVYFCQNGNTPSKAGAYNMQVFTAETTGSGWKNVELLPFCTPENNYMYPSVSPDGQRLFLVAERGGGFGGLDLYVATKTKKGWSRLENLGDRVNTAAHEGFPFAAVGGKLYFCSKGHAGYGGYDIFVTEQDSATGEWRTPKNVGAPFNSPYDDISISFNLTNQGGVFTSTRGGRGDDLFLFTISEELAKRQADLAIAKTQIKVEVAVVEPPKSEEKIEVKIQESVTPTVVIAPKTEEKKTEIITEMAVSIPKVEQKLDTITATKTSETFSIAADPKPEMTPSVAPTSSKSVEAKNYLKQIQAMIDTRILPDNGSIVIESVNYSSSAATDITPDLALALDKIADFLSKNRKLTIEIGEHTETKDMDDNRARQISATRAVNVVKYLVTQGVNAKRISAQGFGRTRPIKDCRNENCSAEEDERNRRIDVKINGIL